MDINIELSSLQPLLSAPTTKKVVIVIPDGATKDGVAAALSLYLSLQAQEKEVTVVYPRSPIVAWNNLVGLNKMTTRVGGKQFIISLDYTDGAIDKVSYNIDGNKFNLVIEQRPDMPELSEKNVSYKGGSFTPDLIFVIGASSLEALGQLYSENQHAFAVAPIIAINTFGVHYGKVNICRPASSLSEIVTYVLQGLQLPVDMDIVSNLYDGIVSGSRNFSSPQITASTFEAAAFCLKNGARKPFSNPMMQEEMPHLEGAAGMAEAPTPPPDWLKPKVFKGGSLI